MTRRRKIAVAGIAVALALAAGAGVAVALRPASLERKLEQVRDGMTCAEVAAIMGKPGTYIFFSPNMQYRVWESRRGTAWVQFDERDTVSGRSFERLEPTGFLDRVLAWLGL